jgi:hypothetical protein
LHSNAESGCYCTHCPDQHPLPHSPVQPQGNLSIYVSCSCPGLKHLAKLFCNHAPRSMTKWCGTWDLRHIRWGRDHHTLFCEANHGQKSSKLCRTPSSFHLPTGATYGTNPFLHDALHRSSLQSRSQPSLTAYLHRRPKVPDTTPAQALPRHAPHPCRSFPCHDHVTWCSTKAMHMQLIGHHQGQI